MVTEETWRAVAYDLDITYEELREKIAFVDDNYRDQKTSGASYHFDWYGEPLTLGEWSILYESMAYRLVRRTALPTGDCVATIWKGMADDPRDDPPRIFETGVCKLPSETGAFKPYYRELHATLDEAHDAHQRIVIDAAHKRL